MNISVLQFLGTNCEYDTVYAFEKLGANTQIVWYKEESLPKDTDLVVIPGGFSYGDYLRSGALAKLSPIMKDVKRFANEGGLVLGICNGFQILTESGLLPGALKRNDKMSFISKITHLKTVNNDNKFLSNLQKDELVNIPVAHHDGNYFCDESTLNELEENNQILFKYCDENGELENLNGSIKNIAGICNKNKNVFGLMPHPERAMEDILNSTDGIKILKGLMS